MSRPFTLTILKPDGSAWAGGTVTVSLQEGIVADTGEVVTPYILSYVLDSNGQIATQPIDLQTPSTGTAHYCITEPDGTSTHAYLAAGVAVDYATLKAVASSPIAQDAVQTALDAAKRLDIDNISGGPYTVLGSDEYIRCSGTFTVTLPAATGSGRVLAGKNIGTGSITLDPDGTDTIDGYSSVVIAPLGGFTLIDGASGRWDIHGA